MRASNFTLMLLLPEDRSEYFTKIGDFLTGAGNLVYMVDRVQAAEDCLQSRELDVILTGDSHTSQTFLSDVDALAFDDTERPLLCMLTEHQSLPSNHTADVVLPQLPAAFLERELRIHVRQRKTVERLQRGRSEVEVLKNAIVHNVSHELKTPLLQVKAAVGLIAEDSSDTLVQMAVTATARLETVVKNITLLADGLRANFGPVLIQESIDQAMRNLRRSWEHKNDIARVHVTVEENLPPIIGDKQGLGIVMQQLIDNALKFSKETAAPVQVTVKRVPEGILIAVKDDGIGIAEDKRKQIFDTFYQVDSSSTRRYGGTGVGLAIVRLVLEKHNVEIKVESTLGQGSRFSFVLPQVDL